jgi:hypothetical protein
MPIVLTMYTLLANTRCMAGVVVTRNRRFSIEPVTGLVTDQATGRQAGRIAADDAGAWRGVAFLPDGRTYRIGPWLTATAAADAVWLVASNVTTLKESSYEH